MVIVRHRVLTLWPLGKAKRFIRGADPTGASKFRRRPAYFIKNSIREIFYKKGYEIFRQVWKGWLNMTSSIAYWYVREYHFHSTIRISMILICIKRKLRFVKAQGTSRFFYWKFHTTLLRSCNLRVLKAFCIKNETLFPEKSAYLLWVAKTYSSIKHFSTVSKTFFTRIKFRSYKK